MPRLTATKSSPAARSAMPPPQQEEARRLVSHLGRALEALLAIGLARREAYLDLQREALVANPDFLGIWIVWEKEALPGPDARYCNTAGHDDAGRFLPYWNRESGDLVLDVITGYERPGVGDWYWVPKQHRQPCTAEPYPYPFRGRIRWLASEMIAFATEGRCLGVVGVDWAMDPPRTNRDETGTFVHVLGEGQAAERLSSLTSREHEVYFWLGQGKSNEEISIILGISAHTVKNHLDHIFQKLGVSNRLAAALALQGRG